MIKYSGGEYVFYTSSQNRQMIEDAMREYILQKLESLPKLKRKKPARKKKLINGKFR